MPFSRIRSLFSVCIVALLATALFCGSAASAAEKDELIVKRIDVVGAYSITADQIKYKMGTREGRPLDRKVLDEDFQRLFKMGTFADVQIKEEKIDGGVRLIVLLREKNLIRRIVFRGNQQVREKKLVELVKSKAGERFDPGQINRDVRAIEDWYRTEFYYFADVKTKTEPFEDGVRLVFEIDEGGRLYVQDIEFRGNYSITKKSLLKFMETKPSTFFTRGKYERRVFEKDLERLRMYYQSKGYLDVKITERPFQITSNTPSSKWQRRDAYIIIDVDEGPQYKVGRVDFEGNKLVESSTLRSVVKTVPGDVFSPMTVQEDSNMIRDIYGKFPSSRYFTKVWGERVLTEEGAVVDVMFHVREGEEVVIEDVQILGLKKTKDRVVRRLIEALPGEKIDSQKINESKRQIRNLGYFKQESMRFEVKPGSTPDRGKVVVDLEEDNTGRLVFGAGVSSQESFVGSIQLSQRNFDYTDFPDSFKDFFTGKAFMGGGQDFKINIARGSETENYGFSFMNPWIFDKPIRFGTSGYYKTYEWDKYDEERLGGTLSLGRRLWIKNLDGMATYKLERVNLRNFDSDVSNELLKEEGENWISRVIFNLTYDTLDNRFDPSEGIRLSATQEFAGTVLGGDRDFWRSFLEGRIFHPFWRDKQNRPWVIAVRGEMGAAEAFGDDQHVPLFERMYAGGIGSIRGFDHNSIAPRDENGDEIGGELMAVGGVEVFVPVWDNIVRASAFYDVGAVWKELDNMNDDMTRSSVGLGLHVKTPLGPMPIRLYYAQTLDEKKDDDTRSFQFTFGAFF